MNEYNNNNTELENEHKEKLKVAWETFYVDGKEWKFEKISTGDYMRIQSADDSAKDRITMELVLKYLKVRIVDQWCPVTKNFIDENCTDGVVFLIIVQRFSERIEYFLEQYPTLKNMQKEQKQKNMELKD